MNLLSIKCLATTSKGCPSRSYMARKNSGSMRIIMAMTDRLTFPVAFFIRKKTGTPISAAPPKHRSCRLVRLKNTLDLTLDKSLGTGIYAAKAFLLPAGYAGICLFFLFPLLNFRFTQAQCADSTLLARLPVLNSEKHSSTV
jgi:hypothetical protein